MKIKINGQDREFPEITNLGSVVRNLTCQSHQVIAEHNGHIVRKPHWEQTVVQEGDTIELITFVGGG